MVEFNENNDVRGKDQYGNKRKTLSATTIWLMLEQVSELCCPAGNTARCRTTMEAGGADSGVSHSTWIQKSFARSNRRRLSSTLHIMGNITGEPEPVQPDPNIRIRQGITQSTGFYYQADIIWIIRARSNFRSNENKKFICKNQPD